MGRRVFDNRIFHRENSWRPSRSPAMVDHLGLDIPRARLPGVDRGRCRPNVIIFAINDDNKTSATVFMIGHSTRPIGEFLTLLQQVAVNLLVDVRSIPRSRANPQFNAEALPETLAGAGIS